MITIDKIIELSKPHKFHSEKARQTVLFNDDILISIVGGDRGLYGDFVEDFEVAIMTPDRENFITRFFINDINDDVIPYMSAQDLEDLVNKLFRKGFQVG